MKVIKPYAKHKNEQPPTTDTSEYLTNLGIHYINDFQLISVSTCKVVKPSNIPKSIWVTTP